MDRPPAQGPVVFCPELAVGATRSVLTPDRHESTGSLGCLESGPPSLWREKSHRPGPRFTGSSCTHCPCLIPGFLTPEWTPAPSPTQRL